MSETLETPARRLWAAGRRLRVACAIPLAAAPGLLAAYVAVTLGVGTLPVATAWLTALVLDELVAGAGWGTLAWLGAGLAAAGIATGLAGQVTEYLRAELGRRSGETALERQFRAVERLVGLSWFENPRFLDRLRLAQQAGRGGCGQVLDGVLGIGTAALTAVAFVASLYVLSPVMTVLVLLSGLPALAAELALARRRAATQWDIGPVERREMFYADLLSTVAAAKEVRLFGIGAFLRRRTLAERHAANAALRAMDQRETAVQAGLGTITALVAGGALLWAVYEARHGRLSVGGVTMFVAATAGVQGAVTAIVAEIGRTQHELLMFDHYLAVTTAEPDLPVAAPARALPPLRDGIELRDVWFRYSDEHPWILRGVDLRIPHGHAVALVGLNGAGKSTLVKLLCRFYDPVRGAILWDGVDLRDVDPAELRRRIGAVFQDYMCYDMTAAENIGLGDLAALDDRDRITSAAGRAGIDAGLRALPRGYDTMLSRSFYDDGDGDPAEGVVLSGGQWQRVALARAFLRDRRDLMILDEPSAGLDAAAEHEVHAALRRHRGDRTSLLISHRLGAVRDADLIVVLADGRVAERGTHAALMARRGRYARLFELQAAGYRIDERPTVGTKGDR